MAILQYATVGSNQLEKAVAFYDEVLGIGGMTKMFDHKSGGRIYAKDGAISFGVLGPFDGQPATPGNGSMCSFMCDSRDEVDAFFNKVIALGGSDEGAPGLRGETWYAAYMRDLDGNKLCAFAIG